MNQEFEAPPMSGSNLPIKEMEAKKPVEEKSPEQKRFFYVLAVVAILLFFLIGLAIGIFLKPKPAAPQPSPTPSPTLIPSPVATSSAWKNDLQEKIDKFEQDLKNVDLKESQLLPPLLDMKIRFEPED